MKHVISLMSNDHNMVSIISQESPKKDFNMRYEIYDIVFKKDIFDIRISEKQEPCLYKILRRSIDFNNNKK